MLLALPRGSVLHLRIANRLSRGVTIVDLEGRIVIGRDNDLLREHLETLQKDGVRHLLLNLSQVTQLDSSGISTIVRAFVRLQREAGALKLLHPAGHVREVLDLTRLAGTIPTMDDEAQAIASFSPAKQAASETG